MMLRREVWWSQPRPRGYGLAWDDPERGLAICYPVPLSTVIHALRWLWFFCLVQGAPSRWEQRLEAAYLAGEKGTRHDYWRAGHDAGFLDGKIAEKQMVERAKAGR